MQWVSATAITVTSGSAFVPSLNKCLPVPNAIALTGLVLAASTFYHVYLYSNAGVPAIEVVTTAPASPYNGTARAKTGDTSRRYVGSVLTDASGNIVYMVPQERWGITDVEVNIGTTQQNFNQGAFVVVQYVIVARDVNNEYNTSTYTFTPKSSGLYSISAFAHAEKLTDGVSYALGIFFNGTEVRRISEQVPRSPTGASGGQVGGNTMMWLLSGQAVTIQVYCGGTTTGVYLDGVAALNYATIYRMQ